MKTSKQFLVIIGMAAALCAANFTIAQDQPRRPGQPGGDRPQGERPQGARPDGERPPGEFRGRPDGARGGDFPALTEEQRDVLRKAGEEHRDEMTQLGERMREARRSLAEASFAEKLDLKAVKAHAGQVAELQAEMSVIQAQIISKLRPKLSPDQIERMKNLPPEFIARGGMGPGFGGPGGPGGFRPGGPEGQRPDGQRVSPESAPRRPRGEGDQPEPKTGGDRPRRPASDSEPK